MQFLRAIPELSGVPGPVCIAIGVFDGVHLGHRAVIGRAVAEAAQSGGTAVVVTFDPHPARVLRPDKAPRLLTSTPHKIQLMRELGASHLLIVPFNPELAVTPPERFIEALVSASKTLREICVGHEWCFGKNRTGNLALLKELGRKWDFDVCGVPPVAVNGETVSSTAIRAAVQQGDFAKAAEMLGREYTILGTVVKGEQLGRKIGFPTANLSAHNEQFPPDGVYAVEAIVCGAQRPGVVNIGVRPTIHAAGGERVLELHLFDFDADIYGQDIEIFFRKHLRPEKKFSGLDELRAQIAADAQQARSILGAAAGR